MIQANVKFGKVSNLLYTLMTQTKAKKFRAGFIKTDGSYRVGKFDLKNRETWKQADGTMYKRKGKERTTNPDEYILAHDLDKKAPRNISVKRLKWFSVGKKVYKINRLEVNEDITIVMFDKVKFTALKTLNLELGLSTLRTFTCSMPIPKISFGTMFEPIKLDDTLKKVTNPVIFVFPTATPVVPNPTILNLSLVTPIV